MTDTPQLTLISREQIEFSHGDGKPWFGRMCDFIEWIATNSDKEWAAWNDRVYKVNDMMDEDNPLTEFITLDTIPYLCLKK